MHVIIRSHQRSSKGAGDVPQRRECLPSMHKAPSLLTSALHTLGMEARACDLSPGKIAIGESDGQSHS